MPCPNNHLAFAIITTVIFCIPFGIVAIIKASRVSPLYYEGHYEAAQNMADSAKKYSILGLVLGIIRNILYFFFCILVGLI